MYTINLEAGMPTGDAAMKKLMGELSRAKARGEKTAVVIHGYGSHGTGGVIKDRFRSWLKTDEAKRCLAAYCYGEDFDMFNGTARNIHSCDSAGLKEYYGRGNRGVTVIQF